ncbi:MAG: hypothetical protein PF904_15310 [Kiritimatiellae bacterium]|jgi:ABC-type dipeptide/oligopeptide/nickel transport system permease component|nr:hypothetical protein [Kiritimatiellia bacterium]
MNKRVVFHIVSIVTLVIGIAMGVCSALSYFWQDPVATQSSLLTSSAITVIFAIGLMFLTRGNSDLSRRDGAGLQL